jgi:uncharacterized protein (TIGR00251 family)
MDFIEIKANNAFLLRVKVKTNSIKQEILPCSENDSWLLIKLKSKPIKNKANKELIHLIRNRVGINSNQIKIISGLKKTNKTLEITIFDNLGRADLCKKLLG